jgi:hypothetical protein
MRQQARLRAVIYRLVRRPRGTLTPGIVPPPPPAFTIGALTAADKASGVLTAAGASSALTASTAPGSTLTAGDQRTGGPT